MSTLTQMFAGSPGFSVNSVVSNVQFVFGTPVFTGDDQDDRGIVTIDVFQDGVGPENQIGVVEAKATLGRKTVKNGSNTALNVEATYLPNAVGSKPTTFKFYVGAQQNGTAFEIQKALLDAFLRSAGTFTGSYVNAVVDRARLG